MNERSKGTIYIVPTVKGKSVKYVIEGDIYDTPEDVADALEGGLTEEQKEELTRIALKALDELTRSKED